MAVYGGGTELVLPEVPDGLPRTTYKIIRGYRVRIVYQPLDPEEARVRRNRLAEIIARSILRCRRIPNDILGETAVGKALRSTRPRLRRR